MATNNKPALGKPELSVIRELAEILHETELTDIELEKGDLKLKISKKAAKQMVAASVATPAAMSAPMPAPQSVAPETPAPDSSVNMAAHPGAVKSPMVGTVYMSAEPGKPPFVNVGDKVKAGDTLMLIEAMKTFNPITAPEGGTVKEILVQDGTPVEFDEPLIVIG